MTPTLHPWINTPEARSAAKTAVRIPLEKLPRMAYRIGRDELEAEALAVLTECATPVEETKPKGCAQCGGDLSKKRRGTKFCGPVCKGTYGYAVRAARLGTPNTRGGQRSESIDHTYAHKGSMWTWPEDRMEAFAVRQIGLVLANFVRTFTEPTIPASDTLANLNVAEKAPDGAAYDYIVDFLEESGLTVMGDETFEELAEAALSLRAKRAPIDAWAALANYVESRGLQVVGDETIRDLRIAASFIKAA